MENKKKRARKTNISTFTTSLELRLRAWQCSSQPLVEKKPDTTIIQCGTNDINKTSKSEAMIASEIVALAKSIGSNGIDVCLIIRGDILEQKRQDQFCCAG